MTTLPTTVRDDALNLSTDLAQAGTVFNDATRLLDGGLWSTPADNNNQPAYLGLYTTDINAVLDDINAALANPGSVAVSGDPYTLSTADTSVLSQVAGQLQTLLTEAPQSVGNSHNATAAQGLVQATQTAILNEINGDLGWPQLWMPTPIRPAPAQTMSAFKVFRPDRTARRPLPPQRRRELRWPKSAMSLTPRPTSPSAASIIQICQDLMPTCTR